MLTANKLEKLIELEDKLRTEYQERLHAQAAEIDSHIKRQAELQATIGNLQATINKQLETITELSSKATANQRTEQLNRELTNRSEKLQEEVTTLKQRVRALQKDLTDEREQVKALSQYDAARMKKNLDANKKKLAEQIKANELLQKTLKTTRTENAELQGKVTELEGKLAELEQSREESQEEPKKGEEAAA